MLFVGLVVLLFYLHDLVLIVITAIVLASSIEPAVRFFMRYKIGRIISVLLVYLLIFAFLSVIGVFFLPPILDDAATFLANAPRIFDSIQFTSFFSSNSFFGTQFANLGPQQIIQSLQGTFTSLSGSVFTTVNAFFGGIASFFLIIVFSFYFAVQETGVDDFLRIVTPVEHEEYVLSLWKRSQDKIGKWMQGQVLLGVLVGVMLYLLLTIFGIPYALLLAIIAAVFELIPVFGQFLAALPAIAVAYTSGGFGSAIVVTGIYVLVQLFESNLFYPLVVKKIVGVPPLLVILALLIGAKLAGFLGVLLSVPIAAALQEFVNDIQKRKERELARMKA